MRTVHHLGDAGPIIQSREESMGIRGRHARCLACGGRVEMYAHDLGSCQTCGRDFYMEWVGNNKYRCRRIPV